MSNPAQAIIDWINKVPEKHRLNIVLLMANSLPECSIKRSSYSLDTEFIKDFLSWINSFRGHQEICFVVCFRAVFEFCFKHPEKYHLPVNIYKTWEELVSSSLNDDVLNNLHRDYSQKSQNRVFNPLQNQLDNN